MATSRLLRPCIHSFRAFRRLIIQASHLSSTTASTDPPSPPRHLLSIADLDPTELTHLIYRASQHKSDIKSGRPLPPPLQNALLARTVALLFTKRSTRTRVSTEAAIALLGGHPLFLGAGDIQLGVNESLYDTSVVVSSMVAAIVARVDAHADIATMAENSSVPIINALSDMFHPMQTVADLLTLKEEFAPASTSSSSGASSSTIDLGLSGLKLAWIGDANNVLFDLALGCAKLGLPLSVATPSGHSIPDAIRSLIHTHTPSGSSFSLTETHTPEEAVRDASVLVTDTWISMGQESEEEAKMKKFEGFQITRQLAERGGAREGWRFMHCLPRHKEEVSDDVFYDAERSLVFPEAENRLWSALAVLEGFVVQNGRFEG